MSEAFVYRWRNVLDRRWYIGYHKGDINDGYICSSPTTRMLIQQYPAQWHRRVLRSGTKAEMIELERRLLTLLQARTNVRSLNRSNGNGTIYGGRKTGSKSQHADLNVSVLNTLTADQVATMLLTEVDPRRRLKLHQYVVGRTTSVRSRNNKQKNKVINK